MVDLGICQSNFCRPELFARPCRSGLMIDLGLILKKYKKNIEFSQNSGYQ